MAQLLTKEVDGQLTICSPLVGVVAALPSNNSILKSNDVFAEISVLGVRTALTLPSNIHHRITLSENLAIGVGIEYMQTLAQLNKIDDSDEQDFNSQEDEASANNVLSPQAGRFYHRPSPDADAFVNPGDKITVGKTIGLLEVMKTFSPVKWNPDAESPQVAVAGKYAASDGGDVEEGQALLELT
ncbi:MAG: biotin/lipoyl-containing protein [Planctomycetota bacterium]|jgi:acetyl-CoA carboxylase biotin carboxyl carrier protein|nr:biotin/lipoyl-containing protein [Planctomycetota bacterium]